MKILVVGDFHGKFPKNLKKEVIKADLILCTGDFGGSDRLLKIIFKYFHNKWWKKVGPKLAKQYVLEDYNSGKKIIEELNSLNRPVYIVPGNWDFIQKSKLDRTGGLDLKLYPSLIKEMKNLHYWRRGIKKIKGLRILSFGGMVTAGDYIGKNGFFKGKKRKKFFKRNNKEVKQIMSYSKRDVDLILAHYPPYGYFDKVKFKGENPMNGKHVGFRGYTKYIKKNQPSLFVCGHMHEYQGTKKIGKILIVATGSAKEGKAALIDFDEVKKKVRKIKFLK
jgi:Icc-related predicted phosphoesterase